MKKTYILIDFASIAGAYLHLPDEEFGKRVVDSEGKEWEIPDPHTCLERFQHTFKAKDFDPTTCIIVKEPKRGFSTRESKRSDLEKKGKLNDGKGIPNPSQVDPMRLNIFREYKSVRTTYPPEIFVCKKAFFDLAEKWLLEQGAISVEPKAPFLHEGDDIINELSIRLPNTIAWSRDKDMAMCEGGFLFQREKGKSEFNPDLFPVDKKYTHVYRAIVTGDSSDSLPSCKGFGPKKWEAMVSHYEKDGIDIVKELFEMLNGDAEDLYDVKANYRDPKSITKRSRLKPTCRLHELKSKVNEFPHFQMIIDQAEQIYQVFRVMNFHRVRSSELKWTGGMSIGSKTLVTT